MKFTGKVEKGTLKLHDIGSYRRFLNGVKGEVWVEIKEAPKMRSVEQNNYYRHIIRQIGNHLGYNEDEMHEVIKLKFEIESTKNLTKDEFSDLLDRIIRFSATLGFAVQDPRKAT
tara:strand:+ start:406 stop:750 length:345 start_codon:yes stop_codon:yes gene_type:complete